MITSDRIDVTQAKKTFFALVSRAQDGRETVVEKQGTAVARLVPTHTLSQKATAAWRERRKGIRLNRQGLPKTTLASLYQEARP